MASLISKFYLITRSHKGWSCCCNISQLPLPNLMGCVVPFHQACDPNSSTHEQIPIPLETQFGSAAHKSLLFCRVSSEQKLPLLWQPWPHPGPGGRGRWGSAREGADKPRPLLQGCSLIPLQAAQLRRSLCFPLGKSVPLRVSENRTISFQPKSTAWFVLLWQAINLSHTHKDHGGEEEPCSWATWETTQGCYRPLAATQQRRADNGTFSSRTIYCSHFPLPRKQLNYSERLEIGLLI